MVQGVKTNVKIDYGEAMRFSRISPNGK